MKWVSLVYLVYFDNFKIYFLVNRHSSLCLTIAWGKHYQTWSQTHITRSYISVLPNTYYKSICDKDEETRTFCAKGGIDYQDLVIALETPGVGRFILAMALEGFVFLLGLYILESG